MQFLPLPAVSVLAQLMKQRRALLQVKAFGLLASMLTSMLKVFIPEPTRLSSLQR